MKAFRAFSWLFPVVMVCLLIIGGLKLKQNYTSTLNRIEVEDKEFSQSPGCAPEATDVNPSLPPCRLIPITITGKERQTLYSRKLNRDYYSDSVDVQDVAGHAHHLTEIGNDFWSSLKVEDQITAESWKGRIIHLVWGGSYESVLDTAGRTASLREDGTEIWLYMFIGGFCGLAFWSVLRKLRTSPTFGDGGGA